MNKRIIIKELCFVGLIVLIPGFLLFGSLFFGLDAKARPVVMNNATGKTILIIGGLACLGYFSQKAILSYERKEGNQLLLELVESVLLFWAFCFAVLKTHWIMITGTIALLGVVAIIKTIKENDKRSERD